MGITKFLCIEQSKLNLFNLSSSLQIVSRHFFSKRVPASVKESRFAKGQQVLAGYLRGRQAGVSLDSRVRRVV